MLLEFVRAVLGGAGFTEAIKVSPLEPLPTSPLGVPTVAHTLPLGETSDSVALTEGCKRVSIHATVAGHYTLVTDADADSGDHFIGAGERLDMNLPAGSAYIAAIAADADGTLYISELG